ncbi:TetR/AcrR family transcriptional regulator [Pikeienuella piscinae]|uniref:TetR/AcrR family transcriptional regulator n=1 Tax=Pikeienuella piscinae TaxID=2748098 RepID=A0A7L5BTD5_9RHOB|nr:TetR/AcrR family transcriptional regulator [Pikeienuella piscinae]QIE54632.1 TetR/AcrR family transcriptional regulator [Pikeienuella piscinae]
MVIRANKQTTPTEGENSALSHQSEIPLPRKPERANGVARYKLLVDTVEILVANGGTQAVTIQAIAKKAGVPTASVYHFFPSPIAACIAAAERHQEALASIIFETGANSKETDPGAFFRSVQQHVVAYYNANPIARRLILGSDCSWHIRKIEVERNEILAEMATSMLAARFGVAPGPELKDIMATCLTLIDAVWSLSIAKHDLITAHYAEEAHRAAAAYVLSHLPELAGPTGDRD